MSMIPIRVVAFFLASLLVPQDVSQFAITMQGHTIQWTKQDAVWQAVVLPSENIGKYAVVSNVVSVSVGDKDWKFDMTNFIDCTTKSNMTKETEIPTANESIGTPVLIERKQNSIILSQSKGSLFTTPVTITWAEPKD